MDHAAVGATHTHPIALLIDSYDPLLLQDGGSGPLGQLTQRQHRDLGAHPSAESVEQAVGRAGIGVHRETPDEFLGAEVVARQVEGLRRLARSDKGRVVRFGDGEGAGLQKERAAAALLQVEPRSARAQQQRHITLTLVVGHPEDAGLSGIRAVCVSDAELFDARDLERGGLREVPEGRRADRSEPDNTDVDVES